MIDAPHSFNILVLAEPAIAVGFLNTIELSRNANRHLKISPRLWEAALPLKQGQAEMQAIQDRDSPNATKSYIVELNLRQGSVRSDGIGFDLVLIAAILGRLLPVH